MKQFRVGVAFNDDYSVLEVSAYTPMHAEDVAVAKFKKTKGISVGRPKAFSCDVILNHGRTTNSLKRFEERSKNDA